MSQIIVRKQTAPDTPAANNASLYVDSTTGLLTQKTESGVIMTYATYKLMSWGPFSVGESPITTHGYYPAIASIGESLTLVKWVQACYVATTNNGSNYWTLRLANAPGTVIHDINTSTISPDSWTSLAAVTSFTIGTVSVTDKILSFQVLKTGTPGGIYVATPFLEVV